MHSLKESILNLELALKFKIAQTANKSELSTLSASESSITLKPFNINSPRKIQVNSCILN